MTHNTFLWKAEISDQNKRLLAFLKEKLSAFTKADIRWSIERQRCRVNAKIERFESTRIHSGDVIEISLEKATVFTIDSTKIVYEDSHLLIYNKPTGINSITLINHIKGLPVHRLDRDTSGVILIAKTEEAQSLCENLFRNRQIRKSYLALTESYPKESSGMIKNYLGKISQRQGAVIWGVVPKAKGVIAQTEWVCLKKWDCFSLIRCFPHTGRTHQIRIHLRCLSCPIVGDATYGSRLPHPLLRPFRPLLHAEKLDFFHPITLKRIAAQACLPKDFEIALSILIAEIP
jgi:23S rRNA pseudouridine955/2504/2580 synthase